MSTRSLIESFKDNVKDFIYSGSYMVTEELADEGKAILSGLDKLKLDDSFQFDIRKLRKIHSYIRWKKIIRCAESVSHDGTTNIRCCL